MKQTLVEDLISLINSWSDIELKAHYANDGDDRFDFMGYAVTNHGRQSLEKFFVDQAVAETAAPMMLHALRVVQTVVGEGRFDQVDAAIRVAEGEPSTL